jgi:hypothetical protein
MIGEVLNPLGKSLEQLARNGDGFYTLFQREDEEAITVGTSYDLEEIKIRANSMAMEKNPDVNPKKYNGDSSDGILGSYFDVYNSKGNFIFTGKIPEGVN